MEKRNSFNWEKSDVDLGIVKENTKVYYTFKGYPDMKEVKEVKSGCTCIKVFFNPTYRTIDLSIITIHFPFHLRTQSTHTVEKSIIVYYMDNTYETLTFSYTLKK